VSIFYKDCPQCAATHAASAVRCSCGHFFVLESEAGPELSPELRAQEEKLYEIYLAARRDQTARAMEAARAEASRTPGSAQAARLLAEAEAALKAAQAELDIQMEKSAESRRLAEAARAAAVEPRTAMETGTGPNPDSAQPTAPIAAKPAARSAKIRARSVHEAAARADKSKVAAATHTRPVPSGARAKTETRAQVKAQKAARAALARTRAEELACSEADSRARQRAQSEDALRLAQAESERSAQAAGVQADAQRAAHENRETPAQTQPELAPLAHQEMAEQAFRAAQAAKANHALVMVKAEQHAAQAGGGAAFRAAQSARAAQIVATVQAADTKECPSCTASVALLAKTCRCGFTFPAGSTELPVLTLSAVELAELFGTPRS